MWISIKARENTTHIDSEAMRDGPVPRAQIVSYNAAASANQGIWFFFWLWAYNTFRAFRPQYFLPLIVFGIYLNVTATYGCIFPTITQVYSLTTLLLEVFFIGFGMATAAHFAFLPITTRDLVTLVLNEYLHGLKAVFDAQRKFIESVPHREWQNRQAVSSSGESQNSGGHSTRVESWPEADAWKAATIKVTEAQVKIHAEMPYVKRETCWGKLRSSDFVCIMRLLKNILVPITGLETIIQITDSVESRGGWGSISSNRDSTTTITDDPEAALMSEEELWKWIFQQIQEPSRQLWQAMLEGIDYSLFTLGFTKKPAFMTKEELASRGADLPSGKKGFAAYLEDSMQNFLAAREEPLKKWCKWNGLARSPGVSSKSPLLQRHQTQLYLILDLEYCLMATAKGVLNLVHFADRKVEDGTMAKKRFIHPTWKQLKKWFISLFTRDDGNLDYQTYSYRSGTPTIYLGDALGVQRDPEHLPPVTKWERFTDKIRLIPQLVGSKESWFGFKVAVGTFFISITCYLRNSQEFYIKQRIIWGAVMVAISMTQTTASGLYGQFVRIFGTFLAMVFSYINWYIVDGHTAGVIVFIGITCFLYHYLLVTRPDDPVIPMIGTITLILILAYELQVKKVGIAISTRNGQVFHPVYELAPYRLAAVLGGVGIACFLSYFPTVNTSRAEMRKDLGATQYLLGHYYSSTHKAVSLRLKDLGGDEADKNSPIRKLEKARSKLFAKQLILIQSMENHLKFIRYEPTFGGRFPRETYERLLHATQNILRSTAMIAFVTKTFRELPEDVHIPTSGGDDFPSNTTDDTANGTGTTNTTWAKDFREVISTLQLASHGVTSLLAILSGSITHGRPVPPYLREPDPYDLGGLMEGLDTEILNTVHVCEPGYSAFAVMQLSTTMLHEHLAVLLADTKLLVGEADFDLDVVKEDYEKSVGLAGVVPHQGQNRSSIKAE
ncbi:hypothetical protein, variant [Exophiala mesophila]|nr:hypothetical protein, variant [Exophiala mesophila]KIV89174.1 hypothetical protein, variant [Exophiala mesophila]